MAMFLRLVMSPTSLSDVRASRVRGMRDDLIAFSLRHQMSDESQAVATHALRINGYGDK